MSNFYSLMKYHDVTFLVTKIMSTLRNIFKVQEKETRCFRSELQKKKRLQYEENCSCPDSESAHQN